MSPDIASSVRLNNKMTTQGSSAGAKNEKLQLYSTLRCADKNAKNKRQMIFHHTFSQHEEEGSFSHLQYCAFSGEVGLIVLD